MEKKTENMIDKICTATFTRDAFTPDEEFLKKLGKEPNADEGQAVREATFALMVGCTKELLVANRRLEILLAHLEMEKESKEN